MLTTRDAAAAIETTPKILRQFLRQDETFGSVGSGSRYTFDTKDLPVLKKRFDAWAGARAVTNRRAADDDGQPGLPTSVLYRRDKMTQAQVRRQAEERVDRLEAMLKSRGLHISQMANR